MAAQNAEGIILRKYYLRETSYILVVYTKEFGKITGVIKGVRNPYPQFGGDFEIFTRCQLLFYRKKKRPMDLITQCEALDSFLPVRKDIERLTYANYFIELINIVANDYDVNGQLYRTLTGSLYLLGDESSPRRISRIFELKFLEALGMSPQVESCIECGAPAGNGAGFSVKDGGMLCPGCRRHDRSSLEVSLGTLNFMRKIQTTDLNKTARFKVSKEVGEETERILRRFLRYHISSPIKSLKFLEGLRKKGVVEKG